MLPLSDGIHARRFPFVNVALIVANFAVWIFYEIPHLNSAVFHASFYPCTVNGTCHGPEPWGVSWFTAMFMHGSWDHILGNMLFLAIFGKNVEDVLGHGRYLAFYIAGGFVAAMTQALMTLIGGTAAEAMVPMLGASGAIAAVLGAYFVLYPDSRILTLVLVFPVRIPAPAFSAVVSVPVHRGQLRLLLRQRQRWWRGVLCPRRRLPVRAACGRAPGRQRGDTAWRRRAGCGRGVIAIDLSVDRAGSGRRATWAWPSDAGRIAATAQASQAAPHQLVASPHIVKFNMEDSAMKRDMKRAVAGLLTLRWLRRRRGTPRHHHR